MSRYRYRLINPGEPEPMYRVRKNTIGEPVVGVVESFESPFGRMWRARLDHYDFGVGIGRTREKAVLDAFRTAAKP